MKTTQDSTQNWDPFTNQSDIEHMPEIVWTADSRGKIVHFNRQWFDYTGMSLEESLDGNWKSAVARHDLKILMSHWKKAQRSQLPFGCKFRLRSRDGSYNWFVSKVRPQFGKDETLIGWVWLNLEWERAPLFDPIEPTDENQEAKLSLRILSKAGAVLSESLDFETNLKAVALLSVESMADICIIDLCPTESKDHHKFRRELCMHGDVRLDSMVQELKKFPPNYSPDFERKVSLEKKLMLFPVFDDSLLRHWAQNDEHFQILQSLDVKSAVLVPLVVHDQALGVMTLIRTGSGFTYDEADLPLAEEFSRRAAVAIENSRLFTQAQQANDAKTQFLANVSHEIRTPLGAILGFSEILLEENSLDEERKQFLNIIHRNGTQLSELIGDLLDLSKIEMGKLEMELSLVPIKELLHEVIITLSSRAAEKDIQFHADVSNLVPDHVISDPLRMRQVLINLLGNALKFTPFGNIEIKVQNLDPEPHKLIAIDVTDRGIGMDEEVQKRLFQPFTQGDNTMARRFGGTGLGLALARKLAQGLGGSVELLSSIPNEGSTFRFTFAADLVMPQKRKTVSNPQRPAKNRGAQTRDRRILVVDDSLENQMLVENLLKKENYQVDTAGDGKSGVGKAKQGDYDLILMDIQMPVMDGYTAIEELRRSGIQTPIIALTAHALREDRLKCFTAGCNEYLTKPINGQKLRETIGRQIQ